MPYRFLEDLATADVAFEARGATLEELFADAADATMRVMVEDPAALRPEERRPIRLEDEAEDMLLFQLLQELIFLKDAQGLLLRLERVAVRRDGPVLRLEADACGEKLDPARHRLNVDVKAVTLHRFAVERTGSGWRAVVVLDV